MTIMTNFALCLDSCHFLETNTVISTVVLFFLNFPDNVFTDPFAVNLMSFQCVRWVLCYQLLMADCLGTQSKFLSTVKFHPFAWENVKLIK